MENVYEYVGQRSNIMLYFIVAHMIVISQKIESLLGFCKVWRKFKTVITSCWSTVTKDITIYFISWAFGIYVNLFLCRVCVHSSRPEVCCAIWWRCILLKVFLKVLSKNKERKLKATFQPLIKWSFKSDWWNVCYVFVVIVVFKIKCCVVCLCVTAACYSSKIMLNKHPFYFFDN